MEERLRRDVKDGFKWWCTACKTSKTVRAGSFFEKSKIPLRSWILLINLWAYQLPVCTVAQMVEVNKETAINVFQWLREVCSTKLVNTSIVLGRTVQIDESLFRHKPKVNKSHKYIINIPLLFSTTEEGQPPWRCGYLGWWTPPRLRLWVYGNSSRQTGSHPSPYNQCPCCSRDNDLLRPVEGL